MTDPSVADTLDGLRASFAHAAQTSGVVERRVQVAGLPLVLRFAGTGLVEWLTTALEHHGEPPLASTRPLTVHLWDLRETGAPAPRRPRQGPDRLVTDRIAGPTDPSVLYQPELGVLSVLQRSSGEAWYCAGDRHILPWWEQGAPLRTLLAWWLSDHDRLLVHAASVGSAEGAALLVGRGGSGKSSTSLTCLRAGMGFLGDDYCVLQPRPAPVVHSLYATAKVHDDQLDVFGELATLQLNPDRDAGVKALLLPARLRRDQMIDAAPVRVLLAPVVTDARQTRAERISAGGALTALAPSTIFQLPGAGRTELGAMAGLVRQVPCYRLLLGSDRDGIPPVIAELLATHHGPAVERQDTHA